MALSLSPTPARTGWSLTSDGELYDADIDAHEFCIDPSDALHGRDRVMAVVARLAAEECAALEDLVQGRGSVDRYGAPLELETLMVNISHLSEQLRRLSLLRRWPSAQEIADMIGVNEAPSHPRAHL